MLDWNCKTTEECASAVQSVETYLANLHSPVPDMFKRNTLSNPQNPKPSQMEASCSINPMSIAPNTCSIAPERPLDIVMEENTRMRRVINNMVLTLDRWMRHNGEQAEKVRMLSETLLESDRQRKKLEAELEAMKIQVQTTQGDWEAERQDRLQADRDRERAKQIILKLQEENWRLRKSRTSVLISRGPSMGSENVSQVRPTSSFNSPE